ncbi:MAG TPA: FMN-binding protein [Longimicrobiales bacterium]|nr:FMN-binding protein [Longimicrobiales bacterium]
MSGGQEPGEGRVGPEQGPDQGPARPGADAPAGGVTTPPAPPSVPSWRLATTLAVAGAMAGLAIVLVFQWAEPRILEHQARVLQAAVHEVLAAPERHETLFLVDGALTPVLPVGADSMATERIYRGYDGGGNPVGYAIAGAEPGFQDIIRVLFGYDASGGRLLGMRVLDHKETPGLGDKIVKDSLFVGAFDGVAAPIVGVKPGAGSGADEEVDMITGATISSRAVIGIINRRIERMAPLIESYERGQSAGGATPLTGGGDAAPAGESAAAGGDAPAPATLRQGGAP